MTKQELCERIFEDMLNEEILNEADGYEILFLKSEIEKIIKKHLEDYVLVYKVAIINN